MRKMKGFESKNLEFSYTKVTNRRVFMETFHYHPDYELYYLINGTTQYLIGDEAIRVEKGEFVFVPKKLPHKTDSEKCLHNERILVCFGDEVFDAAMDGVLEELSREKLIRVEKSRLPVLTEILQKLQKEYSKERKFRDGMIINYIRELLLLLCRYRTAETQKISEADRLIYQISEYIATHFDESLSLEELSQKFALSTGHLSRKFKSVIGVGVGEYITYIRILNAEKLLKTTTLSITEIADRCGFNDSNYFSTVFRKTMGSTPHQYRKMSGNEE